jgi:5-methylcytosine-specific restriction endonuclease McrA
MESPKSRAHKEKKTSYRRRKHGNKKFYDSKAWRETREAYMRHYQRRLFKHIPMGKWERMDLDAQQVTYILQLEYLPCEICLKLYCADAYDTVEKGVELDHIMPVNPEDALDRKYFLHISEGYGGRTSVEFPTYGDPFSFDNLQLLCKRHHAKKSQREEYRISQ